MQLESIRNPKRPIDPATLMANIDLMSDTWGRSGPHCGQP